MTIWNCRTHVRITSMTSLVERTDLDFKISVALDCRFPLSTFLLALREDLVHNLFACFYTIQKVCWRICANFLKSQTLVRVLPRQVCRDSDMSTQCMLLHLTVSFIHSAVRVGYHMCFFVCVCVCVKPNFAN